jgi:hypothetical protein
LYDPLHGDPRSGNAGTTVTDLRAVGDECSDIRDGWSLLAFNVGVEVGQVIIVSLMFPLVAWAARSRHHRRVVLAASALIFLFGVGWLVERVFGLTYMPI